VGAYLEEHVEDFLPPERYARNELISDELEKDFTTEEFEAALARLRGHSAPGPDTVHPLFLKEGSDSMHRSVLALCNLSWRAGKLPRLWKCANVRPINKGTRDKSPSGYRPISLTSVVAKLLERMLHVRLYAFATRLNLLPPAQSGFRHRHSVLDCLTRLTMAAHSAFAKRNVVVAAFVDLEKAYDTVWRDALLVKLHRWGIRGRPLRWLHDFLRDRAQRVTVDGALSSWRLTEDGVPQGSVLACLLFILFLADLNGEPPHAPLPLPMVDVCESAYFADDLTLWAESSCTADACTAVQRQLDVVDKWCKGALLHASQSKSVCTLFTRRHMSLDALSLTLGGVRLRVDQAPRYLGVILTSDLKWSAHIEAAAAKASATLGAVLKLVRGLGGRSATAPVVVALYRSLVRPYLEYGSQLWFGAPPRLRAHLDAIQRKALQAASGGWRSTGSDALEVDLNVPPLELRWTKLLLYWEARIIRLPPAHPLRRLWLAVAYPSLNSNRNIFTGWNSRHGASMVQRLALCHRRARLDFEDPQLAERMDITELPRPLLPLTLCPRVPATDAVRWVSRQLAVLRGQPSSLTAFTDGSCQDEDRGGAGAGAYMITGPGLRPVSGASRIAVSWPVESFLAELFAIFLSLLAFQRLASTGAPGHRHLHIVSDSRAVLDVLAGNSSATCHLTLLNATARVINRMLTAGHSISLTWIPSHIGVEGNEAVDRSAKASLALPPSVVGRAVSVRLRCPYATARRAIDRSMHQLWTYCWSRCQAGAHLRSVKPVPAPARYVWSHDRRRDTILVWMRHGTCLNAFMHRVQPQATTSPLCPFRDCGCEETVEHFLLLCDGYAAPRTRLLRDLRRWIPAGQLPTLAFLLGGEAPADDRKAVMDLVIKFVRATNRHLLASA
jgi:ribonuclease HI